MDGDKVRFQSQEMERRRRSYPGQRKKLRQTGNRRRVGPVGQKKLHIRMGIGLLVVFVCLLMKVVDLPFSKDVMEYLEGAISYDMDFSEPFGQLKFVQNWFPGAAEVFGSQKKTYTMPLDGEIVKGFGEEGNNGISIQAKETSAKALAAGEGRVVKRATNVERGNYVRLSHPDGLETTYYGLEASSLMEGDAVTAGQELGTLAGDTLYFEMEKKSIPKNPLDYIGVE